MKKTFLLFVILFSLSASTNLYSFSVHPPAASAAPANVLQGLSVNQFIHLSARQYSVLTGKKMSIWDRFSFNLLKLELKHEIKKDPSLTIKPLEKESTKKHRMGAGWWILIGVFGGILLLILIFAILFGSGWK